MQDIPVQFDLPSDLFRVGEALREAGGRPFLVGGWVRDALLGYFHQQDFDLEVYGIPMDRLSKVLRPLGAVHAVGRHFGVLKLKTRDAAYDISVPRRESNIGKGHKAFLVETDPSMRFEDAAARRDFTINAMGYDFFASELKDPWHGRADLERRILRHVGPAFVEDPLRVLRAMQLAGRFELDIAPETLSLCRSLDLAELPRERLWEEFKKLLLQARHPSRGLMFAAPLGVSGYFPELAALAATDMEGGNLSAWEGTLGMLDQAAGVRGNNDRDNLVLMLAALCHRMDPGPETLQGNTEKPRTRAFLDKLTNERPLIDSVATLLTELQEPQFL
ncbi:MAG TPA: hypothetical protein VLB09_05180, partial [Nitrospiria bacterium]|nr:hypothetical protein [Nitrospiria bacterium]